MYKKLFIILLIIPCIFSYTHSSYEIRRKIDDKRNLQQGNHSWEKFKDTLNNSEYWKKIREGQSFKNAFRNIYRGIRQNVTDGMALDGVRYWLEETAGQPAISRSVHSDATGKLFKNETSLRVGSQHIYVLQPHEYVSKRENVQLSPKDVPFFYYCDAEETPRKLGNMTDVEKILLKW